MASHVDVTTTRNITETRRHFFADLNSTPGACMEWWKTLCEMRSECIFVSGADTIPVLRDAEVSKVLLLWAIVT